MVQVLQNQKSLDSITVLEIEVNEAIYIHPNIFQMTLAFGAGNPGWSHTQPKLVCCEA